MCLLMTFFYNVIDHFYFVRDKYYPPIVIIHLLKEQIHPGLFVLLSQMQHFLCFHLLLKMVIYMHNRCNLMDYR